VALRPESGGVAGGVRPSRWQSDDLRRETGRDPRALGAAVEADPDVEPGSSFLRGETLEKVIDPPVAPNGNDDGDFRGRQERRLAPTARWTRDVALATRAATARTRPAAVGFSSAGGT
jgi:hypothetical protein